jgi:4-hydroxybenzoate polyprenyltransferase
MVSLAQRWIGRGNTVKNVYTLNEKISGAIDITRPILTFMGALGVAAAAALGAGGFPTWDKCLVGFIAALLAYAGIHTFNDFADRRRDIECWPGRPIPSQRLTIKQVFLLTISTFIVSLVLIWVFFNPLCFLVSAISIFLACLYSAYLRDRVGYLILPPIQSTLWLCGWTAFSPDTLFTAGLPWILFLFSAAWQAGHIMVYSPLHPIRKIKGKILTQVPALFVKTSPRTAAILGVVFFCICLALGIFLGFYANLGLLFTIPIIIMGSYSLALAYIFMRDADNFGKGMKAFQALTYFMLIARVFMLMSIFLFF